MKVLKFGGTSVGTPDRMRQVAGLVRQQESCIVVRSALARTTDTLVAISQRLIDQDVDAAVRETNALRSHYDCYVTALFGTEAGRTRALRMIDEHFNFILGFSRDIFTAHEQRTILAQGELMSTALLQFFFEETGVPSVLLPALDFMRLDENGEPDTVSLREQLRARLDAHSGQMAFRVLESLRDIPIRMISYGGSHHNISLLISTDMKGHALNALHKGLFDDH